MGKYPGVVDDRTMHAEFNHSTATHKMSSAEKSLIYGIKINKIKLEFLLKVFRQNDRWVKSPCPINFVWYMLSNFQRLLAQLKKRVLQVHQSNLR